MEEIKAGDIMVGNLIYRKYWNPEPSNERYSYSVEKVIGIYKDTIYCTPIVSKQIFKIKDAYPIPLTEDILLKAGFEFDYKGFIYKEPIDGYRMKLRTGDGVFEYCLNTNYSIKIQYLHQLQNLFKSLTGNDLKIEV